MEREKEKKRERERKGRKSVSLNESIYISNASPSGVVLKRYNKVLSIQTHIDSMRPQRTRLCLT